MNKKSAFSVSILTYFLVFSGFVINSSILNNEMKLRNPLKTNAGGPSFANATVISDGYNGEYWNNSTSKDPTVAVDDNGNVHVVWADTTDGPWGIDYEIMYSYYSFQTGWTCPIVISDGFKGSYWNTGNSYFPSIAIDTQGNVHVVWHDYTEGAWKNNPGDLTEIMYAKYSSKNGWTNATIISDGFEGSYWNTGQSVFPSVAVDDSGSVHVVWSDSTSGPWGGGSNDREIMYVKYIPDEGWTNISVISDGYRDSYWNDDTSDRPSVVVDDERNIHVAWTDKTDGSWGIDEEVMYVKHTAKAGWSNVSIISDGYNGSYWNDGSCGSPSLAVDSQGIIHVTWEDNTEGSWGSDTEVMYAKSTPEEGWSNITIISDNYNGDYWNNGSSFSPYLAVDSQGRAHICWSDNTFGSWRDNNADFEIMYSFYSEFAGWIKPIIISDGFGGSYWNSGESKWPAISVDGQGRSHVVWTDYTEGSWGTDDEIMYVKVESGVEKTQELPGAFTLSSNADDPDDDGIFYLSWTEAKNAEEYSVIIKKNGTSEILGSGLMDRTFPVMGLKNGSYTIEIEASNEYGTTASNRVNVTVKIPLINQNSTQNNETQEDDSSSIPFGNHYLGVLTFGVIGLIVIVYYKQKKA
jgi:uncharacterized protein YcnI